MKHLSLAELIEKLESSPRVVGIFTTGTAAIKLNPESDIDLVIVLDKNSEGIKSIYTTIENHFSDIFFFNVDFINKLKNEQEIRGNSFDGMFADWLINGKIEYDPENILLAAKNEISKNQPLQKITSSEKREFWIKINYNLIANLRYYNAKDALYHEALELRLLYSTSEIFNAYLSFRNIPWRGEKFAIQYFKKNDSEMLSVFKKYTSSISLEEKMKYYENLLNLTFFGEYQKWGEDFVIPIATQEENNARQLRDFWNNLAGA